MAESGAPQELPPSRAMIGRIDCPTCGPDQPARVLIRDEEGRPVEVNCLGCEGFYTAEDVGWRAG